MASVYLADMNLLRYLVISTVILSPLHAALFGGNQGKEPDVLIVGDTFGQSPDALRPTKENPVYYIVLGTQQMDIGSSIAGDPMPTVAEVEAIVDRTMASQGYVRTDVGGPMPSIVLVNTFGQANVEYDTWEETDVDAETGEITGTSTVTFSTNTTATVAALVGGYRAQHNMISATTASDLNDAAQTDRAYITVAALDARELLQKKKRIVWRTRMSIPSTYHNLADNLALMLKSAAPYLGGDTAVPVFIDERDRRQIDVQIGDLEVVESDTL